MYSVLVPKTTGTGMNGSTSRMPEMRASSPNSGSSPRWARCCRRWSSERPRALKSSSGWHPSRSSGTRPRPLHGHGVLALAPGVDVHTIGDQAVEAESEGHDGLMASALSAYFSWNCSTNSVAPEKAIWLMYLSTSSSVMPMPASLMVRVRRLRRAGCAPVRHRRCLQSLRPESGPCAFGWRPRRWTELSQEDLVAVEELDDRKDVFRLYVDLALLHDESMSQPRSNRAGRCQKKSDDLTGGHRIFRVRLSARQCFTGVGRPRCRAERCAPASIQRGRGVILPFAAITTRPVASGTTTCARHQRPGSPHRWGWAIRY